MILYLLSLLISILCILYKKNKGFLLLILILEWILVGWSYGNADYQIHLRRFLQFDSLNNQTEPMYSLIMNLFNQIGASYRIFLIIFATFLILVLYKYAKKYTTYIGFVFALYMIFSLCMDTTMVRYTLAMLFVTLGLYSLLDEKDDKWLIKYIIFIIIATSIHVASIFAIIFILVRFFDRKQIISFTLFTICLLFLIIGTLRVFISKLVNISLFNIGTKLSIVINAANLKYNSIDYFRYISKMILIFFSLSILYYIIVKWQKKHNLYKNCNQSILLERIYNLNIITMSIIPLIIISPDLFRLQLFLSFTTYIGITQFFEMKEYIGIKNQKGRISIVSLGIILYAWFNLYLWVLNGQNFTTVFRALFENNQFF